MDVFVHFCIQTSVCCYIQLKKKKKKRTKSCYSELFVWAACIAFGKDRLAVSGRKSVLARCRKTTPLCLWALGEY